MYISLKIFVDKLKRGFPLRPPVSAATVFLLTESGLEMVVFDIIYKIQETGNAVVSSITIQGKITMPLAEIATIWQPCRS